MNQVICICCCEPMPQGGGAFTRNPNVCASCASLSDDMADSNPTQETSTTADLQGETELHNLG